MQRLTYPEFVAAREDFDAAVATTPRVSRFCSSSAWAIAAHQQLETSATEGDPLLVREEDHWLAFGPRGQHFFQPLEGAWMFGSPLVGPDPEKGVDLLERAAREVVGEPRGYLIGGVVRDGEWHRQLKALGDRALQYQEFEGTGSMLIELASGADAWLGRRSRKFRKNLRVAEKRAVAAGISIENAEGSAEALFERILAIQERTEKWAGGTDIFQIEDCLKFYRQLLGDLLETGRLRLRIARIDGRDVAHIFGGVFRDTYRGLQMSYVADFADLGLGNVLQWDNLRRMEAEGIRTYDLGMPSDYKNRWADRERRSVVSLVVL